MSVEKEHSGEIAIVGMAGRFPKARNVEEFWQNLCTGIEGISFFGNSVPTESGFVNARGLLEDADLFDAGFFGVKPKEAEMMDPQHRVFLECAWAALENAGYDPGKFSGSIGVFGGMSMNTYLANNLASHPELIALIGDYQTMLGNDKDFLPTRVSYKLNLTGPSLNIQTACSTSLVAVCVACQHLLNFQCDLALAGAVSIRFPQQQGYRHQEGGIASPDGHCRAFDAKAAGTVPGEGVGIVVLKRCDEAIADGDTIYAVIKGFATNNDGSDKVGFTAPSVGGQAGAIAQAQAMAGVEPETITYIEAHGTGTPLGDPIEIEALTHAFREGTDRKNFCAIGSVKSNIGHLDTAAGVAGLIKTALALHHKKLPPSLHFESPNPEINFATSPFFVSEALRDWKRGPAPRRAGVSSFGIGGTNAHVVLEEAPAIAVAGKSRAAQLLVLSAKTGPALKQSMANLAAHLKQHPELNLADVAHTLQIGRRKFERRCFVVGRKTEDAISMLESLAANDAEVAAVQTLRAASETLEHRNASGARAASVPPLSARPEMDGGAPVVFMFPGQGAQHANMGRELYDTELAFRETVDACCEILKPEIGFDLRTVLYPDSSRRGAAADKLTETATTQPALFVVEYALAQLWIRWGVEPEAMIGHSIGEYVAACVAGVFSLNDALKLVAARGRLMQQQPPGAMLALRLPEREVQSLLKGSLSLAAINAPASCVVSGTIDAIGSLQRELAARDIVGTILRTSHAFHSSMMEPILGPFTQIVEKVELHPPRLPFISNVTGKWITGREAVDAAYWATHLRRAVRFADGIAEMMKNPERLFLEVGPGQTLANLARQQPAKESRTIIVSSLPRTADAGSDVETILGALGRLWLSGTDIDWNAFYSQENRRRVALPTYPFERTRYWVEPAGAANGAHTQAEADRVSDKPADHAAFVASTAVNGSNGANGDNAPQTRKDRIAKELRDLLAELSGLSLSDMSEETTFTEVGFESLFLTQASLAIEKKFGVRIAFRQLLEDANCLKGLAGYVESQLPAENPPSSAHSVDRADKVTAPVTMVPAKRPASAGGSFNRLQSRPVRIQPLEVSLDKLREDLQRREQQVKQSIRVQDLRAYAGLEQGLNDLCSAYICECLSHAGIRIEAGGCCTKAQMRKTLELKPAYERFLNYMLTVLEEDQMLRKDERGVHWLRSIDELPHAPSLHDRLLSEFAEFRGIVEMLAHCAGHYRRVLAGEIPGVSVLLPGGRHDFLKQHLQNYADHYKSVKRYEALAKELVEELSAERPLCILEVGAGGGDLTWPLVPKLSGRGCEYHFTDISRTFVQAAQMEAKKQGLDFMRFGVLDISKDPASQGYEPGCFDIVLGLNVVHATARVVESLRHLKSLLVPGGLLCLVELTKYPRWDNMIIGVVEGWWLHDDAFRTDSPLMDLNSWERAFESAGLANAFALPANHDERKATDAGLVLAQRVEAPPDGLKAARSQSDVSNQKPRDVATVPLTSAQREIWFASQMSDAASCSYNECRLVDLRGALHTQALQSALQQLVARHEALRTTFAPDGAIQRVYSSANIEVPIIDLSKHAEDEAPRVLDAAQRSEASRPFDLVNGPLFRTQLFRFSQEHHVLALTVHHIICDGHSFGVVLGELAADYSAILRGGESALPGPLQFSDYARQQTLREADDTKAQEFWSNQFAGGAPVLHLPTDQPRPPVWTFDGSRAVRRLPSSLAAELKRVSSLHRCTLFTTLLASWAVLLQRLTGQSEVVVGVPIADRSYEGGSTVVGHCTNLLPLRIAVRDEDRFTDHLSRLQKLFLDAQEHQNLTFGQLFQKLNLRRETDRMPLVSATLNVERRVEELKMSGLAARVTTNPHTFSNVDLGLNVSECNGTLQLECRYNNHLFVPETIQRWLRHFQTLIESVLTNPQQAMGELAVLTAEEYRRMVEEWNNTHLDCPAGLCIHEAFEAQVERTPDAVAAVFNDESLTYRQLNDRADRIAKHLKALDVGPDVRVGICVERSIAMLAGLLGILKAGGAYVPLDPSYPRERLTFMLQDSGAPVLLTQERHMADAAVAIPGLKSLCVEAVNGDVARTPARGRATQSDNLAYVIYTSGSTGKPKGVAVTHRNVANFFAAMDQVLGAERGVWLAVTSISFDISVLELFWTLARGFTVTIQAEEKREAVSANGKWRSVAENILRHNVTHMQCTPSLAGALALAPESFEAMRRLSTLLLGGETLPPSLADRLRPVVPRLLNMYGPTEATVWSTTHRLNAPETNIPIGRPVANTQVFILDKRLKPVPIGVPGELFIGGAGVARGYLNRPELTSEKFLEDLVPPGMTERVRVYRTGDLARWRDDGTIQLLGRSDQQVKIRGHRIEPGEIELTLRLHPSVRDCAVIAHDANDSTQLAAFVACHTDAPKPDAKELRRFLEAKVPDYMIPSTFTLLDTLPRTPNGKMDRRALPSPENTRSGACETFARPGTPTEEALVQIWCGILGLKEAGVQDNFFELGGHSLLMTKVIARIRDAFQVEITMRQFFERPTIAGLGAAIEEQLAREIDQLSDEEAQRLVCATP